MILKRCRALASVLLLIGASAASQSAIAGSPDDRVVAQLHSGEHAFWEDSVLEQTGVDGHPAVDTAFCHGAPATTTGCATIYSAPTYLLYWSLGTYAAGEAACETGADERLANCIDYLIDVRDDGHGLEGHELVVTLDHPSTRDQFEVILISPSPEREVTPHPGCHDVCYTYEVSAPNPRPGLWTFRVFLHNIRPSSFRMRAELAAPVSPSNAHRRLLPNLQIVPPFELAMTGCQASEMAPPPLGTDARRCLRFSSGPMNDGDGPLDLRIRDVGTIDGVMYQYIHQANGGDPDGRPAGRYEWHAQHAHYHQGGIGGFELYRVEDETDKLSSVSKVPKVGFCVGDGMIALWDRFDIGRQKVGGDCGGFGPVAGLDSPTFYMSKGWGDMYPYWVEANYLELPAGAGFYVALAKTDPKGDILETNEKDNVSYTYFHVDDRDRIEVLERGLGLSPWDKKKVLLNDTRWGTLDG